MVSVGGCCCTNLKTGCFIIGVLDILFGFLGTLPGTPRFTSGLFSIIPIPINGTWIYDAQINTTIWGNLGQRNNALNDLYNDPAYAYVELINIFIVLFGVSNLKAACSLIYGT